MTDSNKEKALSALEAAADELRLPQIGEIINARYRITENLGTGATSWVWGGEHLRLGQKFAIKFLLPSVAEDPKWLERFREEARITSLLGHENIVFVTEFGESEKYGPYLVMEYLEGENLLDILESSKPLSFQEILQFALAISSALSAIHELGIVHCDLKPKNIFLDQKAGNHIWKMFDFGISNFVTDLVKSERLFGTPSYMAPEQAIGLELDSRADQFSLGVILYELLTGQTPWKLNSWSDAGPEPRARYNVSPPSIVSNCPAAIDATILRALSIQRQDRFPTIEDFIESIQENFEIEIEARSDPFEGYQSTKVSIPNPTRSSVNLDFENSENHIPKIIVTFVNTERLRREYRRNLIAGRLFINTKINTQSFAKNDKISIELICNPKLSHARLAGTVRTKNDDGIGIVIDPLFRKPLNKFLKEHRLGFGFVQRDILQPIVRDFDSPVSVGEAFVLTKLKEGGHSLGWLRAQCSSLPIDFEGCISSLIEKEYAQLSQSGMAASSVILEESIPMEDEPTDVKFLDQEITKPVDRHPNHANTLRIRAAVSKREIGDVLKISRVFVAKQNYLAAISILESIVDIAPDAALHFELATLFESFGNNPVKAKKHRAFAIELESSGETIELNLNIEEE